MAEMLLQLSVGLVWCFKMSVVCLWYFIDLFQEISSSVLLRCIFAY